MEKYIEKLKGLATSEKLPEPNKQKETEKLETENPCVVCCITMGKEPHTGHLLLLTIAEQINTGMGSKLPVLLVNNNTGPRAAGAVVVLAESFGLSLEEAVEIMNMKAFDTATVVKAYRERSNDLVEIERAVEVLSEGSADVFAVVAEETEKILGKSGYDVQIVSEAKLLKGSENKTKKLNETWLGTGFVPFLGEKRIVVLEKMGQLTATGALLTSVDELAEGVGADLTVIVDSQPDIGDVVFVRSTMEKRGAQVLGTGIGFEGKIASGTKGEAITIKEVAEKFYAARPDKSLKKAALYLTLTRPLYFSSKTKNLGESFYNFKDNMDVVQTLVDCSDRVEAFVLGVVVELEQLALRVGKVTKASNKGTQKIIEFLPQKLEVLELGEPARVLSESKKVLDGVRQNYYFGYLNNIIKTIQNIESVTEDDFLMLAKMVECCLIRLGL